jgi:hypothetical protein
MAVVFDREASLDTAYFYLNGAPVGTDSSNQIAGDSVSNDTDVWIGSNYFKGNFDELRISSTVRSADWIETEFNNQKEDSTFFTLGGADPDPPTAVKLAGFRAEGGEGDVVEVSWATAQEIDTLGFDLCRSTAKDGRYERLNSALIPGLIYSMTGRAHSYQDADVSHGQLYENCA